LFVLGHWGDTGGGARVSDGKENSRSREKNGDVIKTERSPEEGDSEEEITSIKKKKTSIGQGGNVGGRGKPIRNPKDPSGVQKVDPYHARSSKTRERRTAPSEKEKAAKVAPSRESKARADAGAHGFAEA